MLARLTILALLFTYPAFSQNTIDSIDEKEADRIINILASDSLNGRGNYTIDLAKAANFIADYFKTAGLQPESGIGSMLQPFGVKHKKRAWKDSSGKLVATNVLVNVIGVIEGRSLSEEAIIFSAHFDHFGVNEPKRSANLQIYNGANDNASGTTALMLLAKYFAMRGDNERTLIFCAFSGEELGLLGSQYFSQLVDPNKIKAVVNIEMIGVPQVGNDAFFVTGTRNSDMLKLLKTNLAGTKTKVLPDPDPARQLFRRSDNYPFAKRGIPAHTIMASSDDDLCYHQVCDDTTRIDVPNMVTLIRAIALATQPIISGKQTPRADRASLY
jgi:hypothetical protein